jgi:hypothetical protein
VMSVKNGRLAAIAWEIHHDLNSLGY